MLLSNPKALGYQSCGLETEGHTCAQAPNLETPRAYEAWGIEATPLWEIRVLDFRASTPWVMGELWSIPRLRLPNLKQKPIFSRETNHPKWYRAAQRYIKRKRTRKRNETQTEQTWRPLCSRDWMKWARGWIVFTERFLSNIIQSTAYKLYSIRP